MRRQPAQPSGRARAAGSAVRAYLDRFDMSALVFRHPDNLQLELITYGSAPDHDGGGRPGELCESA